MLPGESSVLLTLNSGAQVPQLGFGVWQAGGATERAVSAALRTGYRHVDTARVYGNEAQVGKAIRECGIPRSEIFVTTKLWNQDQGYEQALQACADSLLRLKLDYVDLYLIHWPVPELRLESWRALETLFREGRARSIGVSNYLVPHLRELLDVAKVVPAVNQLELTPFLQRRDTTALCRDAGILLEAYSPLTRGKRLNHPLIVDIASQIGRTPAQVLLRWNVQHGVIVLPKSVTPERIEENAQIFDFDLDSAAMAALDKLEEGLVTGWDPATQA